MIRTELELRLDSRSINKYILNSGSPGQIPRPHLSMPLIISRMEDETLKYFDYILNTCSYPFIQNTNIEYELQNLRGHRSLIAELEQHIECLIIFDHYKDGKTIGVDQVTAMNDLKEIEFFEKIAKELLKKKESKVDSKPKSPPKK